MGSLCTCAGSHSGDTALSGRWAVIALAAPMLKTLAHLAAAAVSVIAALALSFMPAGTGLLVAALLAMVVGAEIERRRGR